MSEIYYALIVLPIIIIAVLSFAFQSSVEEITFQQFRLACPYPVYQGNVTIGDPFLIDGINVNYTITYAGNITSNGVRFQCLANPGPGPDTGDPIVNTSGEQYGATFFGIPWGWIGYVSHTMTEFFNKVDASAKLVYLFVFAPAEATDLPWFIYANVILLGFVSLGIFMVIRG